MVAFGDGVSIEPPLIVTESARIGCDFVADRNPNRPLLSTLPLLPQAICSHVTAAADG